VSPAAPISAARLRHGAEALAGAMPPPGVAVQVVANPHAPGLHGYRRAGTGETFWQFRRYQSGDAAAAIDWRRSARGRHIFVREKELEAAQNIWLWCDGSPSMHYGRPEKAERAAILTLASAILLLRAGERVALSGGGADRKRRPTATVDGLAESLSRTVAGDSATPALPRAEQVPRHARLLLFSDFLIETDALNNLVMTCRRRGIGGALVQVIDGSEEDLPFSGRVRFDGLENEGSVTIGRVASVRDDYRHQFTAWRNSLRDLSVRSGWPLIVHRTDRAPQNALLAIAGALTAGPS